ncbi:MAG: pilus assembly protein PilB, partial [Marinobacter sp.]
MRLRKGFEEKSRLGRLLVNRGYLSEDQLDDGLRLQRDSGKRLGEVFIAAGWITERELGRVLKHQSRYRSAAAMVTMVALPFQPLVTFAASNSASA